MLKIFCLPGIVCGSMTVKLILKVSPGTEKSYDKSNSTVLFWISLLCPALSEFRPLTSARDTELISNEARNNFRNFIEFS